MMQANLHGKCTTKRGTSVNIFSNFNICKETFDRKIREKSNKSNGSKRTKIKTATISDVSQNANAFPSATLQQAISMYIF